MTGARRRVRRLALAGVGVTLVTSACSAPGPGTTTSSVPSGNVSTALPTEKTTVALYLESNFAGQMTPLTEAFTRKYPNITFSVKSDEFANLLQNAQKVMASPEAPDIVRYPQVAAAAKNGLLTNLDPYAKAYGWDTWPSTLLDQMTVNTKGVRGSGPLYGLGIGYGSTGVYYNKTLAKRIGMTQPPKTIDEFESLMAKAKKQGIQPIMQSGKDAGLAFPYQALQNQFGNTDELKKWLYNEPGATFDLPSSLKAAEVLRKWARAEYLPSDVNAIDYPTMMGRFAKGEGLFMFNGDWEASNLQKNTKGNTGFFLVPGTSASAPHYAMAAPSSFVIPKNAKHADVAAFFLNWVHTAPEARRLVVETTGSSPGGPSGLALPKAGSELQRQTLAGAQEVASENGAVDFVANATAGILAGALSPGLQELATGRMSPRDFVDSVQEAYESELGR
ncbi:ABC transporter substrate-binding protein [Streptomyces muensis]|uniref:Extracellular solute-binding protein n=1 Tax=Streptomyces muensis TaxID=1077944 RepID=A0A9X1PUM3_STRM4|nr:extracellular solute-binding protein [Streptomyces muensis]MCF1592574.1 extracellular solute-binding protein [Streptomyces muensis]